MQQSEYPMPSQMDSHDQPPVYNKMPPPAYQPPGGTGYHQQPAMSGYGQPIGGQPVMVQPTLGYHQPGGVIVVAPSIRPPSYMALAIVTCICFNPLFGIIAIIVSSMSSASADGGDMESARSQGRVSLGLSIAGMVICAVVIIVLVVILTSNPYGPY